MLLILNNLLVCCECVCVLWWLCINATYTLYMHQKSIRKITCRNNYFHRATIKTFQTTHLVNIHTASHSNRSRLSQSHHVYIFCYAEYVMSENIMEIPIDRTEQIKFVYDSWCDTLFHVAPFAYAHPLIGREKAHSGMQR